MTKEYIQFKVENAVIFDLPPELGIMIPRIEGKLEIRNNVLVIYIEDKDLIRFKVGAKKKTLKEGKK